MPKNDMFTDEPRHDSSAQAFLCAIAVLMTLGVVMASSTAVSLDRSLIEVGGWKGAFGRQAVFVVVSAAVMLLASRFDVRWLRWRQGSLWQPWMAVLMLAIGLLVCVWLPGIGHGSHGRHRWINLGPVVFQPSEFAKFAVVVVLAAGLTADVRPRARKALEHVLVLVLGGLCALVGLEDFGTAALLAAVGGSILFVGRCRLRVLIGWAAPAMAGFVWLLVSHPYRLVRLTAFRHIWDDPLGTGYHPIQSLTAIASGGWTGRGLGAGVAQYGYLPEARTDFVFAIVCEQAGFAGGCAIIGLFVLLCVLGLRMIRAIPGGQDESAMFADGTLAERAPADTSFCRLFVFGVVVLIGFQALMNIAVVTVVAPTKGISLPFVSAGGSGTLCLGAAAGLAAGAVRFANRSGRGAAVSTVARWQAT